MKRKPKYLIRIGGIYYYRRRVPKDYLDIADDPIVQMTTKTDDYAEAAAKIKIMNKETEQKWWCLKNGVRQHDEAGYKKAMVIARNYQLDYHSSQELADQTELVELRARLDIAERLNREQNDLGVGAVLGVYDKPEIVLSGLMEEYSSLVQDRLLNKSPNQLRKWRNPKLKAIKNFRGILTGGDSLKPRELADKALQDITVQDVLSFRRWWVDRIASNGLSGNSANKDMGNMSVMFSTVSDFHNLGLDNPFSRKKVKEGRPKKRASFSPDFMRAKILADGAFEGLHPEAIAILYIVIWTGARPSEICNLRQGDFVLDHKIPHIKIRPGKLSLKSEHAERDLPLLFQAHEFAGKYRLGFGRFYDKADDFSTITNSFLRKKGFFPTENHSLYSFRHTFSTLLTNSQVLDRVQCELMGHAFKSKDDAGGNVDRIAYGEGAWLKTKLEAMLEISKHYSLD